jgi:TrmH family RNA methyltransferase
VPQASPADLSPLLSRVCVVLYEPQDDINIGNTVRACKNFGITDIRLVRPASGDPDRILISAPKAEDVVAALKRFGSLEDALADCQLVLGTTARPRNVTQLWAAPPGAAQHVVTTLQADEGARVAVMFGREDSGLPNDALDRCQVAVTVPTDPAYSSLNLGQAVLLLIWEVFRAAQEVRALAPAPGSTRTKKAHPPASQHALDHMIRQAEQSLIAVDFIKPESHDHIMHTFRSMFQRMQLDTREVAIWHGAMKQITETLKRHGWTPPG